MPTRRWLTLLKARAIENQAYVCAANRIGVDNLCLEYNGQSTIFDFKGKTLTTADNEEKIIIAEFDKEALEKGIYIDTEEELVSILEDFLS